MVFDSVKYYLFLLLLNRKTRFRFWTLLMKFNMFFNYQNLFLRKENWKLLVFVNIWNPASLYFFTVEYCKIIVDSCEALFQPHGYSIRWFLIVGCARVKWKINLISLLHFFHIEKKNCRKDKKNTGWRSNMRNLKYETILLSNNDWWCILGMLIRLK